MKLRNRLNLDTATSLDEVLDVLRKLETVPKSVGPFEREMLADTIRSI